MSAPKAGPTKVKIDKSVTKVLSKTRNQISNEPPTIGAEIGEKKVLSDAHGQGIKRIDVKFGSRWVDYIKIIFLDGHSMEVGQNKNGKDDQKTNFFQLDSGEGIMAVYVWKDGSKIAGLQFQSTVGHMSAVFGNAKGDATPVFGQVSANVTSTISQAMILQGFTVWHEGNVRGLKPSWIVSKSSTRLVKPGGQTFGGTGGSAFTDLTVIGNPLLKSLAKVEVTTGKKNKNDDSPRIFSIQCFWRDGKSSALLAGSTHGKASKSKNTLTLGAGESVIAIEVRSGKEIDAIRFITKKIGESPVHHPWWGGNEGSPERDDAPAGNLSNQISIGMGLIGFMGRNGERLDQLQALWAANPPVGYKLLLDSFSWKAPGVADDPEEITARSSFTGNLYNLTDDPIVKKITYEFEMSETQRFQVDESTTETSGMSTSATVEVGTTPPATGGVSVTASATFEAFTEISGTFATSNELTKSTTERHSTEEEVTIPPKRLLKHKGFQVRASYNNVPWTGRLFVKFADGTELLYGPVSGTFSGVDSSSLNTVYELVPIKPNPDDPNGTPVIDE